MAIPSSSSGPVSSRGPPVPSDAVADRVTAEIITPSSDEGDFSTTAPITVIFRMASTQATGLLVAQVGGIKKEIFVRAGIPEYVTSNVASELLGAYLVQCGALSSGELAMALAR